MALIRSMTAYLSMSSRSGSLSGPYPDRNGCSRSGRFGHTRVESRTRSRTEGRSGSASASMSTSSPSSSSITSPTRLPFSRPSVHSTQPSGGSSRSVLFRCCAAFSCRDGKPATRKQTHRHVRLQPAPTQRASGCSTTRSSNGVPHSRHRRRHSPAHRRWRAPGHDSRRRDRDSPCDGQADPGVKSMKIQPVRTAHKILIEHLDTLSTIDAQ
jgi:hypothetical protein